jgi:predicted small metal-binding protein
MKNKMDNIFYTECADDGFRIESMDKGEVAEMLKKHVKDIHGDRISDKDADTQIKMVGKMNG